MVARATGTASPLGRFLDGLCDHGVFILIYVALAITLGTAEGWVLAVTAGAAHIVQSSLYEGERARFHRRAKGIAAPRRTPIGRRAVAAARLRPARRPARPARRTVRGDPRRQRRPARARPALRGARCTGDAGASLLSANVRVWLIALACLAAIRASSGGWRSYLCR